jgi:hemerythrin-like domain-containing protein
MAADLLAHSIAPGFDDPLGMLAACHRRIERELATLDRLQRHLPEFGCDHASRTAALAVMKYFDGAAPNHHLDEEESLFPRLRALPDIRAEALIDALERDHGALASAWRRLRPLLASIAAGVRANLSPKQVSELSVAYVAHIAREESALIPLAAQALDADALRQIGREMAARRNTRFGEKSAP